MNLKNAWNAIKLSVVGQKEINLNESKIIVDHSEKKIDPQNEEDNAKKIESLNKQTEFMEARKTKNSVLQTSTKPKEDPKEDTDRNISNNRRAYMDDMWAICERA